VKEAVRMDAPPAFCGLDCSGCPVLLATRETDPDRKRALREEVIRVCREQYGIEYSPADVTDCDGCPGTDPGRLFSGCAKCEIRKCVTTRDLKSCAFRAEYPCGRLGETFKSDPSARSRLDDLRRTFAPAGNP
jgi:hypothetical protein